ncbi:MAG: VOC family protein [Paracoccaceae bacterium]
MTALAMVAVLVPDYDEAIAFYTGALGTRVAEDAPATGAGGPKRWVRLSGEGGADIVLARATGPQAAAIGDQAGGRVWLFFRTADFAATARRLRAHGATFEGPARAEPYGTVAVFRDPWGNRCDLLGPA